MQTQLGPYTILGQLGAGGMGEVYRARDTRLGRVVAIKVLAGHLAGDASGRERFEREARTIASLNHPHICTLYDVGSHEGSDYLVMELVEGETLAAKLKKGPVALDQALRYAVEIADALDKAHRKGITHRDLKPGNIMLTKSGAKLLDFGLAKLKHESASEAGPLSQLPTTDEPITAHGMVVGTPHYMAPEQIGGGDIDARADIFAFGAVLYEMLTGKRAFDGKNQSSVIAKILETDPPPISSLQPMTPAALARAVKKCLAKEPDDRWQSAADLRDELKWISEGSSEVQKRAGAAHKNALGRVTPILAVAIFAAALGAAAVWLWKLNAPEASKPLTRLSVDLGPTALTGLNLTVAISPDGRRIVFPARGADGRQMLATRLLDQADPAMLPGTEGGSAPFFSPDGQWIGFFAANQMKKISTQGGATVTITESGGTSLYGAGWGVDGNIVAAIGNLFPLFRLPAAGGILEPLTKLEPGEVTHRWPQVLPNGNAVLFAASPSAVSWDSAKIEAISLKTGTVTTLLDGGYYPRYLPTGHLLYVHQGVLYGVKFDEKRLEASGTPTPLLQDIAANSNTGAGQFDFSRTGTLAYEAGQNPVQTWQMAWLDALGKMTPLMDKPGTYSAPRLSPDGEKLAFVDNTDDIYIRNIKDSTTSRLTFTGHANFPIWASDGKHVVFQSSENGLTLFWMRADGSGQPQKLLESPNVVLPWDVSPNGKYLAYFAATADNPSLGVANSTVAYVLGVLPLDLSDPDHPKPGEPEIFAQDAGNDFLPRFSPDGHWIAYRGVESGSNEIYVRPFPASNGGKWQISTGGGLYAFWSNNRRELFYETTDERIMVVDYTVESGSFVPGRPRLWSNAQIFYGGSSNLDMTPDGRRFVVFPLPGAADGAGKSVHVTMLENFFDEVKRKIP